MLKYVPLSESNLLDALAITHDAFAGEFDDVAQVELNRIVQTQPHDEFLYVGQDEGTGEVICLGGILCDTISLDSFSMVWIAVKPEKQKQGHGTALIQYLTQEAIERLRGEEGSIILAADAAEKMFYENLGFVKQGCIHDDMAIMVKIIQKNRGL